MINDEFFDARKQPLYQMDSALLGQLQELKTRIHSACVKHINQPARVQTVHGQIYEGYIVHIDATHLYLKPMPGHVRGFYGPYVGYGAYENVILPLVLYELLVISLLS
ncbi:hypothetical protein [Paenibacillus xerothermodurans]|uniref:hypothetical protein n=1 Tax=Paenibacillus xerothermodurans TaxID=1977292 RepID=UPI001FB26628|nr:hypothetical protein [Paenibacillus xerothermodurans]